MPFGLCLKSGEKADYPLSLHSLQKQGPDRIWEAEKIIFALPSYAFLLKAWQACFAALVATGKAKGKEGESKTDKRKRESL